MEDENREEPRKPWDNLIPYEFETARRKEQIFNDTLEYLRKSEKAQAYFAQFNPENLPRALEAYAWQKAGWLVKKEYDEYWDEYAQLQDKNKAEVCLANIQQKRLFEKQCEWRAELFTHPAIESVDDFMHWEHNVLNCPFIDPITPEDVDLYIEYLSSYSGEDLAFLGRWQDYDTYCTDQITVVGQAQKFDEVEEDEDDEDDNDMEEEDYYDEEDGDVEDEEDEIGALMPPWYLFWDERRGAGNYRMLTDVRKPKEMVYKKLAQEEENELNKKKFETNPPDTRQFLTLYGRERLIPFIEQFEDPAQKDEILKAYEVHQRVWNDEEEDEKMYWVKEAWHDLRDCLEKFPIAPGITDWKKALIQTAKNWEREKLKRLLPIVYDEYLFRIDTGIEHPYNHEQVKAYRGIAGRSKAWILRGRELKGEPRDFNF